jgi:hypothetical protein
LFARQSKEFTLSEKEKCLAPSENRKLLQPTANGIFKIKSRFFVINGGKNKDADFIKSSKNPNLPQPTPNGIFKIKRGRFSEIEAKT